MELIVIVVMATLLPIMSILSFLIGYNVNASKKIFKVRGKKRELTEDEKMLQRIDEATVYETNGD